MKFPWRSELAYSFLAVPFICGVAGVILSGLQPKASEITKANRATGVGDAIGGTPADHDLALSNPDEYAWRLFVALNQQALPSTADAGIGDPSRPFPSLDGNHSVVWESWALASGGRTGQPVKNPDTPNRSEVFLNDGATPKPWGMWERSTGTKPYLKYFDSILLQDGRDDFPITGSKAGAGRPKPPSTPKATVKSHPAKTSIQFIPPAGTNDFEVRLNREFYEDIVASGLFNAEAVRDSYLHDPAPQMIKFNPPAKAVKAAWRVLDAQKDDFSKFYCRTQDNVTYGLTALHVMTKDLDNWFWCSFVHESRPTISGPQPDRPTPPWFKDLAGNTAWSHYRLRGTQIAFLDSEGNPTLLGNPFIEGAVKDSSGNSNVNYLLTSCITCHSRATVGGIGAIASSTSNPTRDEGIHMLPLRPYLVGKFDPTWLAPRANAKYKQTPFVWTVPTRVIAKKYPPSVH